MILAQATGLSFSWDLNTATLIALGANFALIVGYMVTTNSTAKAARAEAKEAKSDVEKLGTQVAAVSGNLALLREQVAREHPSHHELGDMEKRLTIEIHRVSDRIDEILRPREPRR